MKLRSIRLGMLISLVVTVQVVLPASLAIAAPGYAIVDISPEGASHAYATAINNHGQAVGGWTDASGVYQAYMWSPGQAVSSLHQPGWTGQSGAMAINDAGQVVGWTRQAGLNGQTQRGFFHSDGQWTMLNSGGSYSDTAPWDINNVGTVLASDWNAPADYYNYLWHGPGPVLFAGSGEYAVARGVNDLGQAVGWRDGRPVLWLPETMYLGNDGGWARDINNSGVVVGQVTLGGLQQGFLWDDANGDGHYDDTERTLISLGAAAYTELTGLNSAGQAIGFAATAAGTRGMLYDSGVAYDLNDLIDPGSGLTILRVDGINDSGQIVGYALADSGSIRAVMLTPTPEPGTMALLMAGAMTLLRRKRR